MAPLTDEALASAGRVDIASAATAANAALDAVKGAAAATAAVTDIASPEWGRRKQSRWYNNIGAAFMISVCPLWIYCNWIALEYFNGSLSAVAREVASKGFAHLAVEYFPRPSPTAAIGYALWVIVQGVLYHYLPGQQCFGQRTPGGHILEYTANGVTAWAATHVFYLTASVLGLIDPALIPNHWEGLLFAVNIYGFVLALAAQLKGYWFPTYAADRKVSGSFFYDMWAGVELNPRIFGNFDVKFFHNGRPGIVAWTLIDIAWAAYQRQQLGYVTYEMVVLIILHACYVVHFFCHEDWYTRTIDITHDHFGFMLAWGDVAFLPTYYTLQAQYLARYPQNLSLATSLVILCIGCLGFGIFWSANDQKDIVRSANGKTNIWGRPASFIRCSYRSEDGKEHQSLLLTSGWWGVSRHANYTADMILSWAMCATCGFDNLLPWSYFIFMVVLLCHREQRDERRCRSKYGAKWDEYCSVVRSRLIPGIY